MEKYIPLDALVAEIERRIEALHSTLNERETAVKFELKDFLSFLDTLEVKEVDLEKEIEKCLKRHNMLAVGRKDFTDIAKHFFELGMGVSNKAQKGE